MKWKIRKFIKEFRNIKNVTFEFIRGGTTIIIGENNVGKSNLLDYFYSENKDWDEFEVSDENYEEEESLEGLAPSYRKFSNFFNLFFSDPGYPSPYLFHPSNPRLAKKPREGQITLSYKIYYFDLTASTSFLTEWGKKELKLKKVKFRSHQVLYGRWDEGKSSMINYARDYFVIESKEKPKEEFRLWKPNFNDEKNFIKYLEDDEEVYHGYNKGVSHPLDKLGSGYLKIETLKSLTKDLKNEQQAPKEKEYYRKPKLDKPDEYEIRRRIYPSFAHTPILLMDEPEIFLHPSLASELANAVKKAEEKNITTILTTHSPTFLSHFINEIFSNNNKASLVILRKDKDGNLKPPIYFYDWAQEVNNREKIISKWMSYCQCFRKKIKKGITEEINSLYYNQWKTILNAYALKAFFSEKVLFVEGPSDYVLLTSEIIERKLEELEKRREIKLESEGKGENIVEKFKTIEIIPIFGKSNYVFFSQIATSLGLRHWFLLDMDKNRIDENRFPERNDREEKTIEYSKNEESPTNCLHKEIHTCFWYGHKGEIKSLEEIKEDKIVHSLESKISWFPENMEEFLTAKERWERWQERLGNEWTENIVREWKKREDYNTISKVNFLINWVKTNEEFLNNIEEKHECKNFAELITNKEPHEIINAIKDWSKHNKKSSSGGVKQEKENVVDEKEWWEGHRWTKETRIINNMTFNEFYEKRLNELGLALGKIVSIMWKQ